jgi:intracellular sulfur oxidation DsrE/DsrF family protein
MKKDELISDEQLNAFTDGELESEEENRIFSQAELDPELDARLCQHRKLKEMVQHAYRDVGPGRTPAQGLPRRSLLGLAAAALMLLAIGAAGGWLTTRAFDSGAAAAAAPVVASHERWLLHVASSDPRDLERALNRADQLTADAGTPAQRRVEIVANEGGLDLLRSDVTPFGDRIRQLAEQDVLFFACSRAIERLEQQGITVRLVPEANARHTALDRVVLRLQDGWSYEKI